MQAAADLVAWAAELATGVEDGHDDFKGGKAWALAVFFYWDAASVICDDDRSIRVDGNADGVGVTGHDFVDAVVDYFIDEMV